MLAEKVWFQSRATHLCCQKFKGCLLSWLDRVCPWFTWWSLPRDYWIFYLVLIQKYNFFFKIHQESNTYCTSFLLLLKLLLLTHYLHFTSMYLTMQHFLLHLKLNTDCAVNTWPQCTCFKQEDVKSKKCNFCQCSILLIPEKQNVTYWKLACSYGLFETGTLPEMFSSLSKLVIYLQVTSKTCSIWQYLGQM